jgi:hypothetical protein
VHDLFAGDLLPLRKEEALAHIRTVRQALLDEQVLEIRAGRTSFTDTSAGSFMPALIWAPIESLLWVCYNLIHAGGLALEGEEFPAEGAIKAFQFNEFVRKLQAEFQAASFLGITHRTESASKSALIAALEALRQRKIINIYTSDSNRRIVVRKDCSADLKLLSEMSAAINGWAQTRGVPADDNQE